MGFEQHEIAGRPEPFHNTILDCFLRMEFEQPEISGRPEPFHRGSRIGSLMRNWGGPDFPAGRIRSKEVRGLVPLYGTRTALNSRPTGSVLKRFADLFIHAQRWRRPQRTCTIDAIFVCFISISKPARLNSPRPTSSIDFRVRALALAPIPLRRDKSFLRNWHSQESPMTGYYLRAG